MGERERNWLRSILENPPEGSSGLFKDSVLLLCKCCGNTEVMSLERFRSAKRVCTACQVGPWWIRKLQTYTDAELARLDALEVLRDGTTFST